MTEPPRQAESDPSETVRARLSVAYRGTSFRGFAANPGVRTVEGELRAVIGQIVRQEVTIACAGRTDAGVHAWGQVVTVELPSTTELESLCRRVNKRCGPDIAVRDARWVAEGFDARRSATSRTYRYHVWNATAPHPLLADTTWHVPQPIDLDVVRYGSAFLVGEHDYSSFCRHPGLMPDNSEPSLVRIVHDLRWEQLGDQPLLRCTVTGSAFCHQQVRSMVGTCIDIGLGKMAADAIPQVLASRSRAAAGRVAPPHGLILWSVGYDGRRWDATDD